MTDQRDQYRDLDALLAAVCDRTASRENIRRIEALADRAEGLDHVLDYLQLDGLLRWEFGLGAEETEMGAEGQAPGMSAHSPSLPIIVQASPATQTPWFSLQSPLAAGAFSYAVAILIVCLMLLGAWKYKIKHDYRDFAQDDSRRSTTSGALEQPQLVFVGRVIGMKDCRWSDPNTRTYIGASAPLGREYALASGLMEVAYSGGARVILEGPCSYKVESTAGGFLERGKLTANIKTQSSKPKAQSSEHSPLSPLNFPLFSVRTPTAIVTDLGTEFGVEVAENGETASHVFQGSVQVKILSSPASGRGAGGEGGLVLLAAGESIIVSRVRAGTHHDSATGGAGSASGTLRFTQPATPPEFVRQIPQPPTASYGSMPIMDSADFAWKYEMDVDPTAQDLDANPGPDWRLHRGVVQVGGDGIVTLAYLDDHSGCLISAGPGDSEHSPSHVWNNVGDDTGYTVELRVKAGGTTDWHGYTLGLYFTAVDSTTDKSSVAVIANECTLWDHTSKYLVDNNRNDDDFHVFRVAQEPNGGKYLVWRDGVLIRLSEGFQTTNWNRVQFGDMGARGGPNVVDYVRITTGAYAPPKRTTPIPSSTEFEKMKGGTYRGKAESGRSS
ncbi:MAG: hypothetical protein JW959_08120 [Pirellulales bacterium]|nr:hypothetical protein [Pirellulales bacterium]